VEAEESGWEWGLRWIAYGRGDRSWSTPRPSVYHGSALGLSALPAWTVESNALSAWYGYSAGSAGDVNGDGYADVIVGEQQHDNGQIDEGRALIFCGNGGPGVPLTPRQRSGDDSRPIAHLGLSDGPAFRLAMRGRTPFGRGKVRFQSEVRELGTPMNGLLTRPAARRTRERAA